MTPQQRDLVLGLVTPSADRPRLTPGAFLDAFSERDGSTLGARLMADALRHRNPDEVQMAVIVCSVFGTPETLLTTLVQLLDAEWHRAHEDLVSLLAPMRDARAVPALARAAQRIPEHLAFDENRALATKAIWALGAIASEEATDILRRLTTSDTDVIRKTAAEQLRRQTAVAPVIPLSTPEGDATRFPALAALMQLYLDPDWHDDFDSVDSAVDTFLRLDPSAGLLEHELTNLLSTSVSDDDLSALLVGGLGGGYLSDPTTSIRAWLSELADRAREAGRQDGAPPGSSPMSS